jgi:radical SAM protein with 4Fe4S-binding SPASM domain
VNLWNLLGDAVVRVGRGLRSRSGRANPRVRHVTGIGYALHAYELLSVPIRAWLRGSRWIVPAVVQVQTINRCNAACAMCPYPYTIGLEPLEIMDDALWEKIALECAREPGVRALVPMAKNEPLLDRKLEDRIVGFRAVARPDQIVELVTNGSALTGERFRRLAASGLDLLTVSLNAASPATYAATMAGLSWSRMEANLEALGREDSSHVNLFVRFIRQRGNWREERAFRRRWRRAGFNVLAFEVNDRSGTVRGYTSMTLPPSLARRLRSWLRRRFATRIFPLCPYAFGVAHVLQNGDVPLCVNDWRHRETLGNVRHDTLCSIWNTPRAQEIRELMARGRYDQIAPCQECSLWREAKWL